MAHSIDKLTRTLRSLLAARLGEFGFSIDAVPSSLIYHYTNASGLKGILESKHIFATNTRYLNDLSEINYGKGLGETIVRSRLESERACLLAWTDELLRKDTDKAKASARTEYDSQIDQKSIAFNILDSLLKLMFNVPLFDRDYYASSFCEAGDLLSQWRGYANRGGGYAIGICVKRNRLSVRGRDYFVFPMIYDDEVQSNIFNALLDALSSISPRLLPSETVP